MTNTLVKAKNTSNSSLFTNFLTHSGVCRIFFTHLTNYTKLSFILLLFYLPVAAQVDFDEVDVELYTFGVGENYWEAFGHSALRIKINEIDYMYGFGYFDFDDEDFFTKFAKGQMRYFLGVEETSSEIDNYINQGRTVWSQQLDLSALQKQQLINKLNFLALVENRYYSYDYFLNNCTSKIRDLLDEVTNGEISEQLKGVHTSKSWNDLTFPVKNQSLMNLGIAIAYGVPAYQARDKWNLSVFPIDFARDLGQINTKTGWNGGLIEHNKSASHLSEFSFVNTHYAAIIFVAVVLLGLFIPYLTKIVAYSWLVLQSLIGVSLLFLWFLSEHSVAAWNINLLLFSPFAFLLLNRNIFNQLKTLFLISNVLWIILALILTNIYLIGFSMINMVLIYRLLRRGVHRFPISSLNYFKMK